MTSARPSVKVEIEARETRLLRALATPGAYGYVEATDRGDSLGVVAPRNGVSVRVGTHDPAAAARLVAADLAVWRQTGGRARVFVSDAGRARLARDAAPGDADPFLAQHKPLARAPASNERDAANVFHDRDESPLAWLATRKSRDGRAMIEPGALAAGERLRRDLTMAGMLPRVTANWGAAVASGDRGSGGFNFSDLAIAARQRVDQALNDVGPEFAGLLVDVCGFLKGLELIESERGWPRRSAKLILVMALARLQRHYGVETHAVGPARSRGVRHWGAEDYRPSLGEAD